MQGLEYFVVLFNIAVVVFGGGIVYQRVGSIENRLKRIEHLIDVVIERSMKEGKHE